MKRSMLGGKSAPTLSQLLEEAKNKPAESSLAEGGERKEAPLCYSRLFDEYHGVVHLEALELLSRECSAKVLCCSVQYSELGSSKLIVLDGLRTIVIGLQF